jgi:hypothetical protein
MCQTGRMNLLARLFTKVSAKKPGRAAASGKTANDDAVVIASAQLAGAQVGAGAAGQRWTSGRRRLRTVEPEYIRVATPATEADWAREKELYRQKAEHEVDQQSGTE